MTQCKFSHNYSDENDCPYDEGCKKYDDSCKKYDDKKCFKIPEVIGRNSCQVLVEAVISFPNQYPAVAIKDIQKEVRDLKVFVCKNKVLINGILHKNVNYKTYEGVSTEDCHCDKLSTFYGSVRHVGANIPFACFIEIPGARPGDNYQIEFAGVEDCCEVDILEDPVQIQKHSGCAYKKLREKVIVKIDLKVLREVQVTLKPEDFNICP